MSTALQVILIVASILTVLYMLRKIRKSHLKIDDSIFWILFSVGLFILSIFPDISLFASNLLGIQSPANFIFLSIIFILLLKQFLMTVKMSKLENRVQTLVQRLAIAECTRERREYHQEALMEAAAESDFPKATSM